MYSMFTRLFRFKQHLKLLTAFAFVHYQVKQPSVHQVSLSQPHNNYFNPFPVFQKKMSSSIVTIYHRQTNRPVGQGLILSKNGIFVTASNLFTSEQEASNYYGKIENYKCYFKLSQSLESDGLTLCKIDLDQKVTMKPAELCVDYEIGDQIYNMSKDHNEVNLFQTDYILERFDTINSTFSNENVDQLNSPFFITNMRKTQPGSIILNGNGQVIGLSHQNEFVAGKLSVISSYSLASIQKQLEQGSQVKRAYAGMSLKTSEQGGAFIIKINSDSPAQVSGLKLGEIIKEINGYKIQHATDVSKIFGYNRGQKFELKVLRENQERVVNILVQ